MEAASVSEVLGPTELHSATCLKTGTSAQSSYGIWRLLFPVSWPYCTPRVGGRAADYVNTIDEPTGSGNRQLSDKIMSVCLPP
jgi:hypothetical protein